MTRGLYYAITFSRRAYDIVMHQLAKDTAAAMVQLVENRRAKPTNVQSKKRSWRTVGITLEYPCERFV